MNKSFYNFTYSKAPKFDQKEYQGKILKVVELVGKNKSVLDIGCGYGFLTLPIRENNNQVEVIETTDNAVKEMKKHGFTVHELDLNSNWSFDINQKYDTVVCTEVIEHLFDTDNLIKNIYKILNQKGELIISTPNVASFGRRIMLLLGINPILEFTSRSHDAGHIRYFTFKNMEELLKEHGFEIVKKTSDYINFDAKGLISSIFLARLFPNFGRSIIIKAKKIE